MSCEACSGARRLLRSDGHRIDQSLACRGNRWGDSAHVLWALGQQQRIAAGESTSFKGNANPSLAATTSAAREVVSYGVWLSRILSAMSSSDLDLLHRLSSGAASRGEVQLSQYLEFQVHGPIRFASDVSKVVIPEKYRKKDDVLALAEQFAAQFECALEWASPAERDPEHALGGSAF